MITRALGIDIGGTKIAAGLVDASGRIIACCETREHIGLSPAGVIEEIVAAARNILEMVGLSPGDVVGVGIGFPGHLDYQRGIVLTTSNLPNWDNVPLKELVATKLGVEVALDNDANAAALAEHRFGAGRGVQHMVYITFSTGVGSGIIIDGHLYRGGLGTAGEVGHMTIDVDGPLCTCGNRGCLLAWASGMALARMAREAMAAGISPGIARLAGGDPERATAEVVAEAARQGDAVAQELVERTGAFLGIGLASLIQLLNPELIVIGGGLSRIGERLFAPMRRSLAERVVNPALAASARIVQAELGDEVGVIGAAALLL